jgi:exodeoxyribonuclease VII large subunit
LFAPAAQQVDDAAERLPRSLAARAGNARADMNLVAGRLRRELLDQRIARLSEKLEDAWRVATLAHPERPLSRGFVRVTARDGRTLTRAGDARAENRLTLHFADGAVEATVEPGAPARPVERKARRSYIAPQPGLFDAGEE